MSNNMNSILILQSSINNVALVRRVIHNQLSMKDELYNL